MRDLGESIEPAGEIMLGQTEVGPVADRSDDAEGLGGQSEGLLTIYAHQGQRTGDGARHATEGGAQRETAQEFVQRADIIGLLYGRIPFAGIIVSRHQHQFAVRGVDAPLEGRFAEPFLDVIQFRVRPTRVIANDVQTQDTQHLQRGHATCRELEHGFDEIADG